VGHVGLRAPVKISEYPVFPRFVKALSGPGHTTRATSDESRLQDAAPGSRRNARVASA
jgi:hypothetical protein